MLEGGAEIVAYLAVGFGCRRHWHAPEVIERFVGGKPYALKRGLP